MCHDVHECYHHNQDTDISDIFSHYGQQFPQVQTMIRAEKSKVRGSFEVKNNDKDSDKIIRFFDKGIIYTQIWFLQLSRKNAKF